MIVYAIGVRTKAGPVRCVVWGLRSVADAHVRVCAKHGIAARVRPVALTWRTWITSGARDLARELVPTWLQLRRDGGLE